MDFVYMPEVLAYGPLRTPVYRDYEQPWNKDYFNYGKSSNQGNHQERVSSQKSKCDQCHLCKQNKRRVLGTYFRKSRSNSCNDIFEEKEEEDEVGDNEKAQAQKRTGEIKSKLSVINPRKS
ncbi:uncharacterized protein [Fopius arisanus]|uniref:RpsB_0 protein n=1 Tax=Fopius arisanus TaxID=64838 RepID=A0A0C9RQ40_9HYME|nr:PREDICTED: uncharacterized protein LOC105267327 [Fopius arisanus]XP_011304409.1 PREDICTED: uncharacterized protein LOC105267327 [Fopius arisanus]